MRWSGKRGGVNIDDRIKIDFNVEDYVTESWERKNGGKRMAEMATPWPENYNPKKIHLGPKQKQKPKAKTKSPPVTKLSRKKNSKSLPLRHVSAKRMGSDDVAASGSFLSYFINIDIHNQFAHISFYALQPHIIWFYMNFFIFYYKPRQLY